MKKLILGLATVFALSTAAPAFAGDDGETKKEEKQPAKKGGKKGSKKAEKKEE